MQKKKNLPEQKKPIKPQKKPESMSSFKNGQKETTIW